MHFKHMRPNTGWIFERNTTQFTGEVSADPMGRLVNVKVPFRTESGTTNFTLKWSKIE